jgi:hypothetical protein
VCLPGAHPSAPLMAFKPQELSNLAWAIAKAFGTSFNACERVFMHVKT